MATKKPDRWIVVKWTPGLNRLMETGYYLASLDDEGMATVLRVVDPAEVVSLIVKNQGREERIANPPAPTPRPASPAQRQGTLL